MLTLCSPGHTCGRCRSHLLQDKVLTRQNIHKVNSVLLNFKSTKYHSFHLIIIYTIITMKLFVTLSVCSHIFPSVSHVCVADI